VPSKSGKMPVASFCVESGRWTAREGEEVRLFSMSKDQLSNNKSKLAARKSAKQDEVWKEVDEIQSIAGKKVMANVKDPKSETSLQLTLEHKKLLEAIDGYVKKLQDAPHEKDDVIGFAVCINGKVNNADVYAANSLFTKLWPKLLKASAVEAIIEKKKDEKFTTPKEEVVLKFLADAESGKIEKKKINERLLQAACENDNSCLFITRDKDNKDAAIRRSYIKK